MHTLGWWFFKAAPWGMPPGLSPLNGLEFSNSVALSDSLPLFALPLKLVAPWLPEHVQFWGYWHLLGFMLQALFALLIARELRLPLALGFVAVLFCLFQPVFLRRIDVHMALSGHWTILAGLYLYLRRSPPPLYAWPLLLTALAAIHGYLLAMVFAFWLAALVQRAWLGATPWPRLLAEILLSALGIAIALWASGVLVISNFDLGLGGPYGNFQTNLLAFINPAGWSYLLRDLPMTQQQWEGANYLGLGMIGLVAIALALGLPGFWRRLVQPRFLPLLLVALGMVLFSISTVIAIGELTLPPIPLPEAVMKFFNIFRSSGRMFWPVGYLLIFAVLFVLARRLPAARLLPVAAIALAVQVVDTHAGWRNIYIGPERIGATWPSALQSPVWPALAPHYPRLRALPVVNAGPHWTELSYFAFSHGMATDAVYLGRLDAARYAAAMARGAQSLADGTFDEGALYALDDAVVAAARQWLRPGDLLARVDGINLFARSGAAHLQAAGIALPPAP